MEFRPWEYQRRGIAWIVEHPRCALFWQMGLGKSVVTLTAMAELMGSCEVERVLVIAPKKVAETTWTTEAAKWDHLAGLSVAKVMGTAEQRRAALASGAAVDVVGRDSFVWLCQHFGGHLPYDAIVIDELTSFKSPRSQRFKAFRACCARVPRIVGLTGTPAPNGYLDLWAQIYCLDGGARLGRFITHYRAAYFDERRWNNIVIRSTLKAGAAAIIDRKLSDICLSMQAADYLELPALSVRDVAVALPPAVARQYREFERERVLEFASQSGMDGDAIMAESAAGLMNKLAQFANGAVYDADGGVHPVHEEKLRALAELVEGACGSPMLVFYQYRHDIERITAALKGHRVEVYRSAAQLRAWNAGEIDVLLAHPASTAYGLNMQQGGHYIAWFGTGYNLELYQQANARLHRQGQRCPVTVYRLIACGTVDERAAAALDSKRTAQQALMDNLKELMNTYINNNH